ncbi:MAG: tRNA (adenosine(37)-N6)-dimethylallyltransferase [Candidatus Methylacidiphilales bacterium]|nr:tRNA (adenosine(37)-N6)-dimethylallyltransferase MiaA [Candidatus Methylacidiphilales bacterium]
MPHSPRILFLPGPTAVGKSALAMAMAEERGAAILSMDAMQLYRGADIGTGKATSEERGRVLHGGLDLLNPGESFSVADYLRYAAAFLETCRAQGQPVIIAGGTGLYYRALTRGLCEAPATSEALRLELDALPLEALQARLKRVDPEAVGALPQSPDAISGCRSKSNGSSSPAALSSLPAFPALDLQNPRRVARAIAVVEMTGISLAEWQRRTPPPLLAPGTYATCLLIRDLGDLRERIRLRVHAMLQAGWVDEVRTLLVRHGTEALARFQAIGYPEIAAWCVNDMLTGCSAAQSPPSTHPLPAEVVEQIVLDTQHYAKRQLTWFRKELIVRQVNLSHSPILNLQEWWT